MANPKKGTATITKKMVFTPAVQPQEEADAVQELAANLLKNRGALYQFFDVDKVNLKIADIAGRCLDLAKRSGYRLKTINALQEYNRDPCVEIGPLLQDVTAMAMILDAEVELLKEFDVQVESESPVSPYIPEEPEPEPKFVTGYRRVVVVKRTLDGDPDCIRPFSCDEESIFLVKLDDSNNLIIERYNFEDSSLLNRIIFAHNGWLEVDCSEPDFLALLEDFYAS